MIRVRFRVSALVAAVSCGFPQTSLPVAASEEGRRPVTLVVYNLENYLAMERRVGGEVVADAPKPEKEVEAVIEGLVATAPDLLGVCEIGDETFVSDLQARLRAAGIDLPHTELVRDAAGWNRNVAFLSRFPIVERRSRDDYAYELDGVRHPFQRGVLDVEVEIAPDYRLRYVGLHLKSKREVPEGDQALMRLNEARLARQHIDRIFEANPEVNLVVAGDFNDYRSEAPVRTLQGAYGTPGYLASLSLADAFGLRWTHYWGFADVYSRIDFVLHSAGMKNEIDRATSRIHHWDNWDKASDHRPLVVKILPEDR
jgi:endonuclease/exonuclease/phosphatase family metal-dependent hydrolase